MEEQQKKKELEKLKRKQEDEALELQIEEQRRHLQQREKGEILKEGKRDPNAVGGPPILARPVRQVNRSQFQTTDERSSDVTASNPVSMP